MEDKPLKKISNRYLKSPTHYRQLVSEQVNLLRRLQNNIDHPKHELTKIQIIRYKVEIARAIAYLTSVGLTAIYQGEIEDRLKELEQVLGDNNE